jgi:hypothetical protein
MQSAPPVVIEDEDDIVDETIVAVGAAPAVVDAPDADSMETIVTAVPQDASSNLPLAPSSSLHPMLLERIEPSLGRGERLRLDASHWKVSLGRGDGCDIRLYTASASREHAVIAGNEAGEWVLTMGDGKTVLIDGESTSEPVVLEVGMNLVLGQDHLRCVTESLTPKEMAVQTATDGLKLPADQDRGGSARRGASWWTIAAFVAIGVGLILFASLRE